MFLIQCLFKTKVINNKLWFWRFSIFGDFKTIWFLKFEIWCARNIDQLNKCISHILLKYIKYLVAYLYYFKYNNHLSSYFVLIINYKNIFSFKYSIGNTFNHTCFSNVKTVISNSPFCLRNGNEVNKWNVFSFPIYHVRREHRFLGRSLAILLILDCFKQ